jgi:hypothetical protein
MLLFIQIEMDRFYSDSVVNLPANQQRTLEDFAYIEEY